MRISSSWDFPESRVSPFRVFVVRPASRVRLFCAFIFLPLFRISLFVFAAEECLLFVMCADASVFLAVRCTQVRFSSDEIGVLLEFVGREVGGVDARPEGSRRRSATVWSNTSKTVTFRMSYIIITISCTCRR